MDDEKRAIEKKKDDDDDWIKCQSKSRPGQSYFFNKTTGETKWSQECNSTNFPIEEKSYKNLPRNGKNKTKTFAQDRLKRLQHRLRSETESKNGKELSKTKAKLEESKTQRTKVPTILKSKNPIDDTSLTHKENSTNRLHLETTPTKIKTKKIFSNINTSEVKAEEASTSSNLKSKKTIDHSRLLSKDDVKNYASPISTKRKNKRSASSTIEDNETITGKVRKIESNVNNDTSTTKIVEKNNNLDVNDDYNYKPTYKRSCGKTIAYSTTKASLQVNGANARLERLRHSLQLQTQQNSDTSINRESSTVPNTITINNNLNDDDEEMDWQPITAPTTITTTSNNRSSSENVSAAEPSTMGEYYDMVNENLMRLSADKKTYLNNKKWLKDRFYVIVDTNVLLDYLAFINDLSDMKLCDTNGTVIYVPYCVLQELDKLKLRKSSEGIRTLTVRAIKFLNANIERNELKIQAQSAIEELQNIINITSPDDSIINCCLQVSNNVENLILLTEDVNLRNKALSNNILVSTKSDLISRSKLSLPSPSNL